MSGKVVPLDALNALWHAGKSMRELGCDCEQDHPCVHDYWDTTVQRLRDTLQSAEREVAGRKGRKRT